MTKIENRLADLKALQEKGETNICPRCGRPTMKMPLTHNALSRLADIYVCDECGMDEAKLAWMQAPGTLYHWKGLRPNQPASDFKALPADQVMQAVIENSLDDLKALYERSLDGELPEAIRYDALETIPGLTELWVEPFLSQFDAEDGKVQVRFRSGDSGIEYAVHMIR